MKTTGHRLTGWNLQADTGRCVIAAAVVLACGVLARAAANAPASTSPYYVKKATWAQTMVASRAALPASRLPEGLEATPWYTTAVVTPAQPDGLISPAAKPDPAATRNGKKVWTAHDDWKGNCRPSFKADKTGLMYVARTITADKNTRLRLGWVDKAAKVWVNGKAAAVDDRGHCTRMDLVAGRNAVLIEIPVNKGRGVSLRFECGSTHREVALRDAIAADWSDEMRQFIIAGQVRSRQPAVDYFLQPTDTGFERSVIDSVIRPIEKTAADLHTRRQQLLKANPGPEDPRWLQLLLDVSRYAAVAQELGSLSFDALERGAADLEKTYPEKFAAGKVERHAKIAKLKADVAAAIKRMESGDGDALADARAVVDRFDALKSEILLVNPLLDFDKLLLVKRSSSYLGLPQNWQGNCSLRRSGYDNEIDVLSPVRPGGKLTCVYRPERSVYVGDVDLHYDAKKMLFSSLDDQNRWQVFEIGTDGKGLTQVTPGTEPDVDNYDAIYLPDEKIIFDSTRFFQGVPCVGGSDHVANLCRIDARRDPASIRQLAFEQDHDWYPTLMPDGKVMYARWEYSDAAHYFSRILFSMNPDGTEQMSVYGSNSYWPNSIFYARPCPGHPTKIAAVISGHHGVPRMGELILFDLAKGKHEADGVVQRIPGYGKPVEPIIGDQIVSKVWPRFLHPWPLSDKYFLVSCQPTPRDDWGIYLVDVFDNMTKIVSVPGYAMLEPVPLRKTPRPPVIPDKVDLTRKDSLMYVADIYAGQGLKGVPRGSVKKLRIYSYHYAYDGMGGHINIGIDGPWDVHRILGTVPVQPDGSVMFRVPANTPLAFQPLDANGCAMQLMRSWTTAMPGEFTSCVGCHEQKSNVAGVAYGTGAGKVEDIKPWRGPARGFSFVREVQPVLDKYCVSCHDGSKSPDGGPMPDLRVNGTGAYRNFTPSYVALHGYVRRPGPESDMHVLTPMEYHADTSELVQMLRKGHHGVKLDAEAWDRIITWIDLNVPDKGTWGESRQIRAGVHQRRLDMAKAYADLYSDPEKIVPTVLGDMTPVKPREPKPAPRKNVTAPGWPFDVAEAARRQTQAADATGGKTAMSFDLGNGVKIDMVLVPAGEFVMGDYDGYADEQPASRVAIRKPFWMGKLEVTNGQYAAFAPDHNSGYIPGYKKDHSSLGLLLNKPDQPAVHVSWKQAMDYCRWLTQRTGVKFSLPTEAQWEYACRAGSASAMSYGAVKADFARFANFADQQVNRICRGGPTWIPSISNVNDGADVTTSCGRYAPNAWGLCDMHGNAAEWTRSTFCPYPYRDDDGRNDLDNDGRKVVRGGSFYDRPKRGRCGFRLAYPAWQKVFDVGFRVVAEDVPTPVAKR